MPPSIPIHVQCIATTLMKYKYWYIHVVSVHCIYASVVDLSPVGSSVRELAGMC